MEAFAAADPELQFLGVDAVLFRKMV